MQVARPTLPLLNIELASSQRQKPVQKSDDTPVVVVGSVIDPIPPSPLSPPTTFLSKTASTNTSSSSFISPSEVLLLNDRYLLLECVENAASPQSQPLRRCIDTITEQTYFCRECCSNSPSTASLLEAHHRLKDSDVITPIHHVMYAAEGDESKIYLLSPASYGDLHSYLRSKRRLKEAEARILFRQAAQAVYDCHRNGVVLTDLKLRRFVFADPQR